MKITTEQANAIDHAKGNLQLIACAGSGKTEVVAQHITKLLRPKAHGFSTGRRAAFMLRSVTKRFQWRS